MDFHLELNAFNAFIDHRYSGASKAPDLEAALIEFRAYQRELAEGRAQVQEAKHASMRGESAELDIEELIREVTTELGLKAFATGLPSSAMFLYGQCEMDFLGT